MCVARIFSARVHLFFDQKSDDLYYSSPSLTWSYSCHILPPTNYLFISSAPHQLQPNFCLISTNMPRKFFFVALEGRGGVYLLLVHPWIRLCLRVLWFSLHSTAWDGDQSLLVDLDMEDGSIDIAYLWQYWTPKLLVYGVQSFENWPIVVIASNKCRWFGYLLYWSVQNEVFYRRGIFGNFFFGGGEFCVFEKGIPGGPDCNP